MDGIKPEWKFETIISPFARIPNLVHPLALIYALSYPYEIMLEDGGILEVFLIFTVPLFYAFCQTCVFYWADNKNADMLQNTSGPIRLYFKCFKSWWSGILGGILAFVPVFFLGTTAFIPLIFLSALSKSNSLLSYLLIGYDLFLFGLTIRCFVFSRCLFGVAYKQSLAKLRLEAENAKSSPQEQT